jgi:hypothetical protein
MAELILIRHSISQPDPQVNSHHWTLTDEGRTKCKILAQKLRQYPIRQIYTSAEAKAVETGQIIAEVLELPCAIASDLGETKREGLDLMASMADFKAEVREAMCRPDEKLFGEESFNQARERFLNEMHRLDCTRFTWAGFVDGASQIFRRRPHKYLGLAQDACLCSCIIARKESSRVPAGYCGGLDEHHSTNC